ncbi:MAG: hypothetical protein AMXMBFR84_23680 [Candidatus Hydrogenedentota bacterium]
MKPMGAAMTIKLCAGLVTALLVGLTAGEAELPAPEVSQLVNDANAAFAQANEAASTDRAAAILSYEKAILRYERAINEGELRNGGIYYNLANAYYLKGDLGRAILNYRRAEQYLPSDKNILQNLAVARAQRKDSFETGESAPLRDVLLFWHYGIPARWRMIGFAGAWIILWLAAASRVSRKSVAIHATIAVSLLLACVLFASVQYEASAASNSPEAVVLSAETRLRKGNSESYQPVLNEPLYAGTECKVLETRGDWIRIALPGGVEGWLTSSAVERI